MAILGLVIFEAILAPAFLGIARLAQASCPERRRDLIVALSCLGLLFLGLGIAVVVTSSGLAISEILLAPVIIATMGVEIGVLFIALNLLIIDHVTGRWEMAMRSGFGGFAERT